MSIKTNPKKCTIIVLAFLFSAASNAHADFTFGEPTNLGPPIWSPGHDPQGCCFSRDGLELYFASNRPGGYGGFDIWVATRETVDAPWGEPVNLGPNVNSSAGECEPAISPDGLELYMRLWDDYNLRVCTRPSKEDPWSNPMKVGPPVGSHEDNPPVGSNDVWSPEISADGLSLYFSSTRVGGYSKANVWVSNRATTSDHWSEPVNLGPIVNSGYSQYPSISSDGLVLFFASSRTGGHGKHDIWVTTRAKTDAEWGPPANCPNINSSDQDFDPAISPDGSVLYFETGFAMWQSSITPIVDLNVDGIVDAADMCIMVDHWGTDNSLCDIGPMPWGDGIVDVEDLKVLAEHLFEEYRLIAHWELDETEGDIAYDSVGDYDGTLMGDPAWQPDSGIVSGALQLDGIDDYVSTDFVLNPAAGPFSVIVWIKGGIPGQVVLSQAGGASWLCTDSVEGYLMTELIGFGRSADVLLSQTSITDGNWHRIGLVWDGSHRHLYIDGVQVAEDASHLSGLQVVPGGGLYFGAGSTLAPGTFFSGLIDDIRIYNRAVNP